MGENKMDNPGTKKGCVQPFGKTVTFSYQNVIYTMNLESSEGKRMNKYTSAENQPAIEERIF